MTDGKESKHVPCPVCCEPIRDGARKCIHCNSWNGWRGWLGISDTALALLVALVTVVGTTAPRIAELTTPKRSRTVLSFRQSNRNFLEVTAANDGNADALVVSATLVGQDQAGKVSKSIKLDDASLPVAPHGQVALLGFLISPIKTPEFLAWPHKDIHSATMLVSVVEFREPQEQRAIPVPLADFRAFCMATADADNSWRHPGQSPAVSPLTLCQ